MSKWHRERWFVSKHGTVAHIFDYDEDDTLCGIGVHPDGRPAPDDGPTCSTCARRAK